MNRKLQVSAYAVSAVALLAMPSAAFAQEAAESASEENTEILVTAQRRVENIQDVPISMTAIQGEALLENQIGSLQDLQSSLPNVHISQGTISNNIYIRGVGSGVSPGFEQAVAVFVDDSYRGRSRYVASTFVDVDRVEVLRGPQTTYFGNNAIGGAFSVTTRGASVDQWSGYGQASYEFEGNEPVFEAAVGGPLVQDVLGVRLAVRHSDLEGWLDNEGTGHRDPSVEDTFVRLSALWDINPSWSATFKVEHGEQESEGLFSAQMTQCPPPAPFVASSFCGAALFGGLNTAEDFVRASNGGEVGSIDADEYIVKLERDAANGLGLVFQISHSQGDFVTAGDTDVTTFEGVTFSNLEETEQTTVEFRIQSPASSQLEWMAGLYYLKSNYVFESNFNLLFADEAALLGFGGFFDNAAPFAPFTVDTNIDADEEAYSAFGSFTYHFSDTFSATLGARYTLSDKTAVQDAQPKSANDPYGFDTSFLLNPLALAEAEILTETVTHVTHGAVEDDAFLPSATLQWEPDADRTYYARYSRGFKAGGFDPLERTGDPENLTYEPEYVDAFEIGFKANWLDGRLRTNLALFHSEYEDLQQAIVEIENNNADVTTTNVGGLISQGVEFSATWFASDEWEFGLDVAAMDAEYRDYPTATCTALQVFLFVGPGTCTQDLTGEAPPYAPDFAGAVRAGYHHDLSSGLVFSADLAVEFSGDYNVSSDLDPVSQQDAWQKLNLRLGIANPGAWDFAVVGRNLTDELILATQSDVVATPGSNFTTVERGRTVAVQLRYSW